jgi:hypothetical protein
LIYNTINFRTVGLDFAYVAVFAAIVATLGILLSWRFLSK